MSRIPIILVLLLTTAEAPAQLRGAGEDEPLLAAADLAQASLLSGPGYRVLPQTPVVGFMARFTLETKNGPMLAESVELLEVRATEMAALDLLEGIDLGDAFVIAVRENIADTVDTVGRVFSQPVATVAGLPGGVARYFRQQAQKWAGRLNKHGDRVAYRAGNDGDPYDMVGPMNANRDAQPERPRKRWFHRFGREVGRQAEDQAGHGRSKRLLARELGIDPYAAGSNPELHARLDRLAWAAAAGSLSLGQLLGQLPLGAREVLGGSERLNDLVWELEPEDLRRRNGELLERWCADPLQIRRFIRHRAFLASVQTRFADALEVIAPGPGCEYLLDLALAADHDVEARFLANALVMAGDFYGPAANGAELLTVGAGLALRLGNGRLVLPLPVDHLSWTDLAREFFRQPELAHGERTVLIAGGVSDRTLRELTALGWEIVVRAPYAGAPPYANRCCA